MSAVKRWFNSLYRTILLGLYLPLANYLVSFTHLTCLGFSPTHVHEFLLRWSQHRGLWAHVHTYYGVVSPPTWTTKETSCACAVLEASLDLRSLISSSSLFLLICLPQQSSASATSFVLGVSGGKETSILLCLTNTSFSAQRGIYLLPQNDLHLTEPATERASDVSVDPESSISVYPRRFFSVIFLIFKKYG